MTRNTGNTQPHAAQKTTKTVVTGGVSEGETEKKKGQRDESQRVVPTEHQKPRGQNRIVNTHQPGHTGEGRGRAAGRTRVSSEKALNMEKRHSDRGARSDPGLQMSRPLRGSVRESLQPRA